jgi:bis(5'-adenosyl)-triphosphatase
VHVHVLPRFSTDFNGKNDDIYPALEASEQGLAGDLAGQTGVDHGKGTGAGLKRVGQGWDVPKDEDRRPRSMREMEEEARWLEGMLTDAS